ncbi:hypothetical protein QYE76_018240 [Lolium multiflorum]|uniref:Uncharacterized protein n=1 Tax=Lolium multiflorum TaxID=4521 RepID=A0AAD8PQE7_LOLMU|nr:hypothetical protein QYE76_018240 [Lolium multiflorum]
MGFAAASSLEGFPYRGSRCWGFATEAISRRKGRSRGGTRAPGAGAARAWAAPSSGHLVAPLDSPSVFWKLRAKIGPWAVISSNSENISLLGFLKPKTAKQRLFGILLIGSNDVIHHPGHGNLKSGAEKAATLATPSAETREPIASSPAAPMVLGEGYDLSNLLTFDPESIEPTAKASEASRVTLARQRIVLRHAHLSLKADIANKCQRLNKKKAALDTKTDTSPDKLEILRKELKDLEERVRVTKQLIQDKEALIARSHEEAEGLKAELKTDLAEIRALNKQLVTGQDEDDEAEIAEVDRVRASALCALEAFLQ